MSPGVRYVTCLHSKRSGQLLASYLLFLLVMTHVPSPGLHCITSPPCKQAPRPPPRPPPGSFGPCSKLLLSHSLAYNYTKQAPRHIHGRLLASTRCLAACRRSRSPFTSGVARPVRPHLWASGWAAPTPSSSMAAPPRAARGMADRQSGVEWCYRLQGRNASLLFPACNSTLSPSTSATSYRRRTVYKPASTSRRHAPPPLLPPPAAAARAGARRRHLSCPLLADGATVARSRRVSLATHALPLRSPSQLA
jgi:hypothetical protein